MAVVRSTAKNLDLLARLMRAEAKGEGNLRMLLVGNISMNRVRSACLDFKSIRSLKDIVFQSQGGIKATIKSYFFQRAREVDKKLAKRVINGERFHPAERSLWFIEPSGQCPAQWYNQRNTGRYKAHCFFTPSTADCPNI